MKHYFIYRKGNDSEKLAKSQREQRKIIKHYHCQEECNEVTAVACLLSPRLKLR